MRILHIGLAACFTEGMTYQDNQLSHQNVLDGHEVLYISNAQKYVNGVLVNTGYENVVLDDGVRLIRLPYECIVSGFVSSKIRKVSNLYKILDSFAPDVILSHGLSYLSVLDVVRYKKLHPNCKLYADTHTSYYNSGRNWFSLKVLHGILYKYLIQKSLPYLEKYLYIGEDERIFNYEVYKVPDSAMEFYPLGGVSYADIDYQHFRDKKRKEIGVFPDEKLYMHSGKLETKKRTKELLTAFAAVPDAKAKMAIIGYVPEEEKELISLMKADERVRFLGWKTGEELQEYLCACDIYCQPGAVSATLQNAICKYCAIIAYPHLHYRKHLDFGNIFWVKNKSDLIACFEHIKRNPALIQDMKLLSKKCAEELLDYKNLAKKLYQQ